MKGLGMRTRKKQTKNKPAAVWSSKFSIDCCLATHRRLHHSFICQGVPSSIWISPSKASQQWRHRRTGHVSACSSFFFWFCFGFFRMNSWIIRSWMWVSATDVNLTIGVSNVGYCLCFRFAGSFFTGFPLAELQRRQGNTRLGKFM